MNRGAFDFLTKPIDFLSHPGGNLTGFTTDNPALGGKWVELLKAIAPRTVRVALLFNPATVVPLNREEILNGIYQLPQVERR